MAGSTVQDIALLTSFDGLYQPLVFKHNYHCFTNLSCFFSPVWSPCAESWVWGCGLGTKESTTLPCREEQHSQARRMTWRRRGGFGAWWVGWETWWNMQQKTRFINGFHMFSWDLMEFHRSSWVYDGLCFFLMGFTPGFHGTLDFLNVPLIWSIPYMPSHPSYQWQTAGAVKGWASIFSK